MRPSNAAQSQSNTANNFFGILGYILLGVILTAEVIRFFNAHPTIWLPYYSEDLQSAFLITFWLVLVVVLLQIGFYFRSRATETVA
jgi:hypothetical protein